MASSTGQSFALPANGIAGLYLLQEPAALPAAQAQQFAAWLSDDERQRWQRFHHAADRQRFLLARALLRSVLAQMLRRPPAELQFSYGRHGKPQLSRPADSTLEFNLSHTRGLLVLGVTTAGAIGVDAEAVTRDVEMLALAERFFANDEVTQLRSLPAPQLRDAFFRLWTLKEAYVKARGLGLQLGLDSFVIDASMAGRVRLASAPDDARWSLFSRTVADRYCVGVAVNAPDVPCESSDLTLESLALAA